MIQSVESCSSHPPCGQLARLSTMSLYLCLVLAASALKGLLLHVSNGNESTEVTDVDLIGIRGSVESLVKELGGTVSYLTVTLHLTKPQTSITKTEAER